MTCHSTGLHLSSLSPAEPVSVQYGRFGGGVVRQEEAVGSGGTGSHREWIQTSSRAQTLIPTGISELKTLDDVFYDMCLSNLINL